MGDVLLNNRRSLVRMGKGAFLLCGGGKFCPEEGRKLLMEEKFRKGILPGAARG